MPMHARHGSHAPSLGTVHHCEADASLVCGDCGVQTQGPSAVHWGMNEVKRKGQNAGEKRGNPVLRVARRMLLTILIIYGLWLAALYTLQDSMLFPRQLARARLASSAVPMWIERVYVDAPTGERVEGWYARALRDPSAAELEAKPAVIFAHGNAELIDDQLQLAHAYRERGVHVLLIEYRGYVDSQGKPSQERIVRDAVAFYDWLAARPEVDRTKIVLHGRSLGTGVVSQLAAQRAPAALILESPFTSVAAFGPRYGAPPFLIRHPFRTDRVLPTLTCPILILHSRHDEIVPFSHGETLHAIAKGSRLIVMNGGHNDVMMNQSEYWRAVDEVLARLR